MTMKAFIDSSTLMSSKRQRAYVIDFDEDVDDSLAESPAKEKKKFKLVENEVDVEICNKNNNIHSLTRLSCDIFQYIIDYGYLAIRHIAALTLCGDSMLNFILQKRVQFRSGTVTVELKDDASRLRKYCTFHLLSLSIVSINPTIQNIVPEIVYPQTLTKLNFRIHCYHTIPSLGQSVTHQVFRNLSTSNLTHLTNLTVVLNPKLINNLMHTCHELAQFLSSVSQSLTHLKLSIPKMATNYLVNSRLMRKMNNLQEANIKFDSFQEAEEETPTLVIASLLDTLLPKNLNKLSIKCIKSNNDEKYRIRNLMTRIPRDLKILRLKFSSHLYLPDEVLLEISSYLPKTITHLDMSSTPNSGNMIPFLDANINHFTFSWVQHNKVFKANSLPSTLRSIKLRGVQADCYEWMETCDLSNIDFMKLSEVACFPIVHSNMCFLHLKELHCCLSDLVPNVDYYYSHYSPMLNQARSVDSMFPSLERLFLDCENIGSEKQYFMISYVVANLPTCLKELTLFFPKFVRGNDQLSLLRLVNLTDLTMRNPSVHGVGYGVGCSHFVPFKSLPRESLSTLTIEVNSNIYRSVPNLRNDLQKMVKDSCLIRNIEIDRH